MSQLLATAVRGDPADTVLGDVTDAVIAAPVIAAPVMPVFVDASGRRRKLVTGFGWLVALACLAYLGVIGVSLTGTSVGPLPDLPSVASRTVVFGSDTAGLPQGALEVPMPAPPAAAAAPDWAGAAKVAPAAPTAAPKVAPKVAPKIATKTALKAAPKIAPKTAPKTAVKTAVKAAPKVVSSKTGVGAALSTGRTSSSASGGASR
jgi:cytoskeletal protein RodZ